MSKYRHLTLEERYHISALKKAGYSQKQIAIELGRDKSTISRELKRNSSSELKRYTPHVAHKIAKHRRKVFSSTNNQKMNKEIEKLIKQYIKKDFSPEQVSATLRLKYNVDISYVRIYQFVHENRLCGGTLYKHLRQQGKRRAKYGCKYKGRIPNRVSISKRPEIVNEKIRIGDLEIDTIIGKGQKGAIITAVDRKSMFVKISTPTTKEPKKTSRKIINMLSDIKEQIYTITTDNGIEFANHQKVSKTLECDYYFSHRECKAQGHPYSSWERGLNENINALIRQYIPKGSSFKNITKKDIQNIEYKLNHRPRKSLNWQTPYEVFYGEVQNQAA